MKKRTAAIVLLVAIIFSAVSCGAAYANDLNENQNNTQCIVGRYLETMDKLTERYAA